MTLLLPPACDLIDLPVKGDARGRLIALEQLRDVPFEIARVYFIYATQLGVERGFHAHRNLNQLAVAVSGSCTMLLDDGETRGEVQLDRPDLALVIPRLIWREIRGFSSDCVLLVLADAPYDEDDYIRDYQQFLDLIRQ